MRLPVQSNRELQYAIEQVKPLMESVPNPDNTARAAQDRQMMPPPPVPPTRQPTLPQTVQATTSDAEQADVDFTVPLMHQQDPRQLAAISVFLKNPRMDHNTGIADYRIEAEGMMLHPETLKDFFHERFDQGCRVKLHFDFFIPLEEFGAKHDIDRALAAVIPVMDRVAFCVNVKFHERALENVDDELAQWREGYKYVKARLMQMGRQRWGGELHAGLTSSGEPAVGIDQQAVWGYGRQTEIISWL